ncbi:MAG: isoleucine--tRNA ligase [Bdellovibrionaceae bacterium]|jgi:isoleucyl-tRNA synthetase|nr:isoleucine--tRNA ligase [Pseudobdellovibrionaceae bacterium]
MSENTESYEDKVKNSISLPKTEFPMRGKLPTTEPVRIDQWTKNQLYQKMVTNNTEKKFVMPDGPPYANGKLHLGHVLNKVLKDIIIKYKNMTGHSAAFIPGWDCHGLPIELKVTKKLGSKRKNMTDKQVRDLCRKEALTWVEIQKEQFIRLGILADWDKPYLTLNSNYEADEVRVLAKILDNGLLYRGEKPVNWCPTLQTALAAAEVEHMEHESPSIYLKFDVDQNLEKLGFKDGAADKPVSFVIWTTTPWTIPANYGICLNANYEYGIFDTGKDYIVMAKDLQESVEQNCEDLSLKLVHTVKGDTLDKMEAHHPFLNRTSLIMLGDHVTLEAGTGCVHTAPGHGLDDYHVGLKYDLPVSSPVGPDGKYTADVPDYEGISIWKANDLIVERTRESGHLIGYKKIKHSYPHNPRSKTPLIFRATPQWFIKMDGDTKLRENALEAIENKIAFIPDWGKQRLNAMVNNTPDWCLSRQRTWGVPIPVFYCKSCDHSLVKSEIMNTVADKMESSGEGIEAFFGAEDNEFTQGHSCENCGGKEFSPGKDILDVWFDSGVCHSAVQKKREGLAFPADIYLEGSDQHRGWFQTSLMSSMAAYDTPPYKALVTHGFVNDAQGYKMSKSKGNVIDPEKVIQQYGAEILRLWVAYEDYGQDVTVGNEMFKRISETYRRIRNTQRFMLGNLHDFELEKNKVNFNDMPALDQWALVRLNNLIEKCTKAYEDYNFYKVYHALNQFYTVELSATYLDIIKDRLYTGKVDGNKRRSSQTVVYQLVSVLGGIMAPILSFIAEETYEYLPQKDKSSIFLTEFPKINSSWKSEQIETDFETLLEVRSKISKELEALRSNKTIGSSLDASVKITANGETLKVLRKYESQLCELFIISQVELTEGAQLTIEPGSAKGHKCIRCWNYSEKLDSSTQWPKVCPKCIEALV